MAAPSSQILRGIELKKHFYGSMPMLSGKAGGTINPGNIIVDNGSGLLVLAPNTSGLFVAGATPTIVGVAKGTAVSGGSINYIPAWNGVIFEITQDNGTTTSATVLADTQRLQQYALGIDTGNGNPFINMAVTTNTGVPATDAVVFTVVDFSPDAVIGSALQRVLVTFLEGRTVWGD